MDNNNTLFLSRLIMIILVAIGLIIYGINKSYKVKKLRKDGVIREAIIIDKGWNRGGEL